MSFWAFLFFVEYLSLKRTASPPLDLPPPPLYTQAIFETQGFPAQAARAAAQTMNSSSNNNAAVASAANVPPMQPGATMQAMANFQQAAAAAMQAAMSGMHGVSAMQLAVTPAPGQNAQQAYTDTMTALAMQQAAAAAFLGQQQQQAVMAAAAAAPQVAAARTSSSSSPTVQERGRKSQGSCGFVNSHRMVMCFPYSWG